MLIPEDPKGDPTLLNSSRLSLERNPDHVVLGRFKGVFKKEPRRSCELSDHELSEIMVQLTLSTIARVSVSRRSAMPPFFALEENRDKLRLVLYVARGTVNEELPYTTWSSDLETLGTIVDMCGWKQVVVPEHVLRPNLSSDAVRWVECNLDEIEASSKALIRKQR